MGLMTPQLIDVKKLMNFWNFMFVYIATRKTTRSIHASRKIPVFINEIPKIRKFTKKIVKCLNLHVNYSENHRCPSI